MKFVEGTHSYAYTQGDLSTLIKIEDLPIMEGFWQFIRQIYSSAMEENYEQLRGMGLAGTPVDTYMLA